MAWINDLTEKELASAPGIVQRLFVMAYCKAPIGSKFYQEVRDKHPEYFTMDPDRIKRFEEGSALAPPNFQ